MEEATDSQPAAKPQRPARKSFAMTTLILEAIVVLFAALVAHGLADLPRAAVWSVGGGLAVFSILVVGLLRFKWGYWLGWAVQGLVIMTAIWLPAMAVVGLVFLAVWWWGEHAGKKIDRERALRIAEASAVDNRKQQQI